MATNQKGSFFRRDDSGTAPRKGSETPTEAKKSAPRSTSKPTTTHRSDRDDRPARPDRGDKRSSAPRSFDKSAPRSFDKSAPRSFDRSDRPARDAKGKFAPRGGSSNDRPARPDRGDKRSSAPRSFDKSAPRSFDRSDRPARDAKGKFAPRGGSSNDRPARPDRGDKRSSAPRSFDKSAPRPAKGVPDWVKQSAPKSRAVRRERMEITSAELIADRKAAIAEQAQYDEKKLTRKESKLTSATPKVLSGEVRLNRFIAQSGVCSRREADTLIEQGLIKVNGTVTTELGSKVDPSKDIIDYDGRRLSGERLVYIIMNKPKGYVTSVEDPHNDLTVITLLGDKVKERVYPVGRLDKNTTGVLLLTNDGDLTRKLTHPSFEQRKIYHAFLDKPCTTEHLDMLASGIELEDGEIHADEVSFVDGNKKEVGIELHCGRNRIVRRMFEHLGYTVVKLDRVFFAGFTKLGLRRAYWRYLSPKEIITLRNL